MTAPPACSLDDLTPGERFVFVHRYPWETPLVYIKGSPVTVRPRCRRGRWQAQTRGALLRLDRLLRDLGRPPDGGRGPVPVRRVECTGGWAGGRVRVRPAVRCAFPAVQPQAADALGEVSVAPGSVRVPEKPGRLQGGTLG